MKKKLIIILSATFAVLLVLASAWAIIINSTQRNLTTAQPLQDDNETMPLRGLPFCMELTPDLRFKFDTGADISTINDRDLETLRKKGYKIKESHMPITGRDGYGKYIFSVKRYTVDLPIGGYRVLTDSLGNSELVYTGKPANTIMNVDFAHTEDTLSTIGLDVLQKFKLECLYNPGAVCLRNDVDTEQYQEVAKLQTNIYLLDRFWPSERCYVIISVNQHPNIFLMDTGLQKTAIKMPTSDIIRSKYALHNDSIRTMLHAFEAQVEDQAWVDFGNRSGSRRVFYYDNSEDKYQVNLLNVFDQDLVIDIPDKAIYFRTVVNHKKKADQLPAQPVL